MTGDWVLAWRVDQAWVGDLEDVDIIEDAGEEEADNGVRVVERPVRNTLKWIFI